MKQNLPSFESSFERLEEILAKMNDGKLSLDESIKLFEEADGLINHCQKTLTSAEQKVQTLIKNRDGSLKLNDDQKPETKDFAKSTANDLPF
jgi:exodeoxyribonuclease VII small subunit